MFLTAFNELTVSALLWSSGTETLGVVIFNLDDSGETAMASALAMTIVLVVMALMVVMVVMAVMVMVRAFLCDGYGGDGVDGVDGSDGGYG